MEFAFGVLIVIFFAVGLIHGMHTAPKKKASLAKVTVTVERVPAKPAKPVEDKAVFNEAKNTLKLYGFSVSDAKDMLSKAGPHDDADVWVKAALETIEI